MNFFALIAVGIFLLVFLIIYGRSSSSASVLRWLHAKQCPSEPIWRQVQELLREISKEQRVDCPEIMVLPEFSPNALVFKGRKNIILISEGMVRTLSKHELQAAISLCLAYSEIRGGWFQTAMARVLFPVANFVQTSPLVIQYLSFPVFSLIARIWVRPSRVYAADQRAAAQVGPYEVAAALQKMSLLARKIPIQRWNIALDHLFLLSPLVLERDPLWLFPSQPTVEQRRQALVTCETAMSLS